MSVKIKVTLIDFTIPGCHITWESHTKCKNKQRHQNVGIGMRRKEQPRLSTEVPSGPELSTWGWGCERSMYQQSTVVLLCKFYEEFNNF
jgi:hypothetical protein